MMFSYSNHQETLMNIKKKFSTVFIVTLLGRVISSAQAQEINTQPRMEMVSGGIGESGMDAIISAQKDYSLKLIFSESTGEYLADVSVNIADRKVHTVVSTNSVGPILLVKLQPGAYTVSSSTDKETKTRKIVVKNTGLSTYYIHLNASET